MNPEGPRPPSSSPTRDGWDRPMFVRRLEPGSEKYGSLSRLLNLGIIVNVTTFVTSSLVVTGGYWFPLVALACFLSTYALILLPWTDVRSRRIYLVCLSLTAVGAYFTGASIVYWLQHEGMKMLMNPGARGA